MLGIRKIIQPNRTIQTEEGYVLLKEDEGNVVVKEIISLTKEQTSKLIDKIEEKASKTVFDRIVLDNQTLNAYQSEGYMVIRQSYNVLMAKPLAKLATFRQVYGEKFFLSSADSF